VAVGLRAIPEIGGEPPAASTLPLTFDGKARPSFTGGLLRVPILPRLHNAGFGRPETITCRSDGTALANGRSPILRAQPGRKCRCREQRDRRHGPAAAAVNGYRRTRAPPSGASSSERGRRPPLFALAIEAEWRKLDEGGVPALPKARPAGQRPRYRRFSYSDDLSGVAWIATIEVRRYLIARLSRKLRAHLPPSNNRATALLRRRLPASWKGESTLADNFVLLSGCSGGGKSTLLAELCARGHNVVEEPGRRIVSEELAGDRKALPWADPAAFARRAIEMALADRQSARALSGWVFFDRGLIDAASALDALTGDTVLETLCAAHRYHRRVFMAPPWPEIYEADSERQHGFKTGLAEYRRLAMVIPALGYEVVTLPKTSVSARADFVLASLSSGIRSAVRS